MFKNKKIVLITIISVILIIAITIGIVLIINKTSNQEELPIEEQILSEEDLENNFRNMFYNIEYSEDQEGLVGILFDFEKSEEDKYNIKVNAPRINLDTETANQINEEIINTYGKKLLDIIQNNEEYTLYNVDYVTFTNGDMLSLVIKSTLKEGSNPQRVIVQTYNYNLSNDTILTLDEVLRIKNLEKADIQSKIIKTIREKNIDAATLANQGYNVYVRDVRSDEYVIENITTFFIGEEGHIFIIFAYGNTNYTETMDIIVL